MKREELAPILHDAYRRATDQWLLSMADAALEALKPTATTPNDDERRKLWRDTLSRTLAVCYVIDGVDSQEAWKRAYQAANAALAADAEKWGKR